MLAFGMRRRQILALFLLEAVILGAVAGIVGGCLAALTVWTVALFGVPVEQILTPGAVLVRPAVSFSFTLVVMAGAAAVAVVAALVPAFRAARRLPAEALRA